MSNWFSKKDRDPKKLREDTNQFLIDLENCLNSFEKNKDPTKLKNKLKKSIIHFKLNFYD